MRASSAQSRVQTPVQVDLPDAAAVVALTPVRCTSHQPLPGHSPPQGYERGQRLPHSPPARCSPCSSSRVFLLSLTAAVDQDQSLTWIGGSSVGSSATDAIFCSQTCRDLHPCVAIVSSRAYCPGNFLSAPCDHVLLFLRRWTRHRPKRVATRHVLFRQR